MINLPLVRGLRSIVAMPSGLRVEEGEGGRGSEGQAGAPAVICLTLEGTLRLEEQSLTLKVTNGATDTRMEPWAGSIGLPARSP